MFSWGKNIEKNIEKKDFKKNVKIFIKPIYKKIWENPEFMDKINIEYHVEKIREILPYLFTWTYNSPIRIEHKDIIKNDLKLQANYSKKIHLMGSIKIVEDNKNNYRIIDGQHRLYAMKEFIEDDVEMKYNFEIFFELYKLNIDDIENLTNQEFDELEKLFSIANKSLNFQAKDNPDKFCRDIIISLKQIYKNCIKDSDKVNRPCISQKYLYDSLKNYLP